MEASLPRPVRLCTRRCRHERCGAASRAAAPLAAPAPHAFADILRSESAARTTKGLLVAPARVVLVGLWVGLVLPALYSAVNRMATPLDLPDSLG